MADSHHIMITAILAAVVVVGISGLYFSMNSNEGPSIVYLSSGPTSSGSGSNSFYRPISQSFAKAVPFAIKAHGITGLSSQQFGTATVNLTAQPDLRMPKNTILCTAQLFQDNDTAVLYTCGDVTSVGGSISCDPGGNATTLGGPGSSSSAATNATTCDGTNDLSAIQANGAFLVCNHGATGELNAMVLNISIGNNSNTTIYLDNYIFNATDNDPGLGCVDDCNDCPAADISTCLKDTNPLSVIPTNVTECEFFDTSGQCVCECFSIHIEDEDDVHLLKNGDTLEFVIKKTIISTTLNSSSECI